MALDANELALLQKAADALKYMPIIYKGLIISDNQNENHHYIKHKTGDVNFNQIIFFVPQKVATTGTETQLIKLLQPGEGYDITSENIKTYTIKMEIGLDEEPWTRFDDCKKEHLKAQRVYMLRRISDTELVVINYRYDTNLIGNSLEFVDAHFTNAPTITVNDNPVTLATTSALNDLAARVTALENKIKVGTEDATTALADEDEGTIYVRVEDYGGQ